MKFKITVTGLLAAILAICLFTSYTLIKEEKKQTEIQIAQLKIEMEVAETQTGLYGPGTGEQLIDEAYWEAKQIYDKYAIFTQ